MAISTRFFRFSVRFPDRSAVHDYLLLPAIFLVKSLTFILDILCFLNTSPHYPKEAFMLTKIIFGICMKSSGNI